MADTADDEPGGTPGDPELDVDVMAALARADGAEAIDLLNLLGTKLDGAIPGRIEIKRSGGLFSRKKTVDTITVTFDDACLVIARKKHGPVATRAKVVRGVQIATKDIAVGDWVREVVRGLRRISETNAEARSALSRLVTG